MNIRKVGKEVLFDYTGMNPAVAKIFGFEGIADDEVLVLDGMPDDKTKQTFEHEVSENDLLNSGMTYWEAHTKLLREREGYKALEVKTMPDIKRKSVDIKRKDGKIIISTMNPDRGGDRVNPRGCHFENYMKNPVVMWLHDYRGATAAAGIPIAQCTGLTISDTDIIAEEPKFLENDVFAARVKNAWDQGFLRTASIGFAPIGEPKTNEFKGLDFDQWELLEWSLVPIPMNAEASRVAKSFGFEELVEKGKHEISQSEIKDEIDYLALMIDEAGLSNDTRKAAQELARRFAGSDIPVDINIEQLEKAFDNAKSKSGGLT